MAKSLHKLPDDQVDDLVLAAIIDEHRQTRRPVATSMVFIAVNAGSGTDQEAAMWSLARLKRAGKITRQQPDGTWLPVAGADRPLSVDNTPTPPPTRDGRGGDATAMAAPSVRPKSRDPMPVVPKQAIADVNTAFGNAVKAMKGVSKAEQEVSFTQEHIDPGLSVALLDRCAAMNMALMVDARRRYDTGNPDAASELSWLMETGRLLRDAGGAACE